VSVPLVRCLAAPRGTACTAVALRATKQRVAKPSGARIMSRPGIENTRISSHWAALGPGGISFSRISAKVNMPSETLVVDDRGYDLPLIERARGYGRESGVSCALVSGRRRSAHLAWPAGRIVHRACRYKTDLFRQAGWRRVIRHARPLISAAADRGLFCAVTQNARLQPSRIRPGVSWLLSTWMAGETGWRAAYMTQARRAECFGEDRCARQQAGYAVPPISSSAGPS